MALDSVSTLEICGGLVSVISAAFVGSYLPAYMKKKAENLATHEDIEKLVDQVRATTEATKAIEDRISAETWDRQRQWEMKRDVVFNAVKAITAADDALTDLGAVLELKAKAGNSNNWMEPELEARRAYAVASKELNNCNALARLICSSSFTLMLAQTVYQIKKAAKGIKSGEQYLTCYKEIAVTLSNFYELARVEVGASKSERGSEQQTSQTSS